MHTVSRIPAQTGKTQLSVQIQSTHSMPLLQVKRSVNTRNCSSYPMRAARCLTYSDAWPTPRGNMTRDFGPIPATLGGSCRGEPADGMMVDRALRNREPAVSISSDWFSLFHFSEQGDAFTGERRGKREKKNRQNFFGADKEISWHRSRAQVQASRSAFPPLSS